MTKPLFRPLVVALALSASVHGQTTSDLPPPAAAVSADQVSSLVTRPNDLFPELNLPSTPLNMVVLPLEELTGRTVLRQQGLPNPEITLVFKKPPTRSEAMQALVSVLNLNQIAIVPLGTKFLKLIPVPSVRTEAPELIEGSAMNLPASGHIVSKLFQLNFLRVAEFIPQIAPLLNPNIGNYALFEKANAVLVTDSVSNLQRIENLITKLDKPSLDGFSTRFYSLKFAKASDLVNKLRTILQGPIQSQLSTATSYNADDRTNQIVLVCDARQFALFDDLIKKLDVKADPNTRNEVVYLKHATSKDVASLLSNLVSGQNKASQQNGANANRPAGQAVGQNNTPPPAQPAGAPPAAPSNLPAVSLSDVGDSSAEFSSLITIQADERSNAIIMSGTVDDIRLLKELIAKVDVILPQVSIEVIVAEVTLNDNDTSGIQTLGINVGQDTKGVTRVLGIDQGSAVAGGSLGALQTVAKTDTVAQAAIYGLQVNPFQVHALLGNTGTKSIAKILQAPNILTMHNQEGTVVVGSKLPIISGTTSTPTTASTSTSTGLSQYQTVTYTDIAIELKVKPLIGDDGTIQLKIDQKVDDQLGSTTINGNDQPIIGHRQATSFVNVRDGEMIVLGGMQRSTIDRSRTKLGFLWEIPIVSNLLGSRSVKRNRTELLLFIRPKIIAAESGTADAQRRLDQMTGKENIKQFLDDPSKPLKESVGDKIK